MDKFFLICLYLKKLLFPMTFQFLNINKQSILLLETGCLIHLPFFLFFMHFICSKHLQRQTILNHKENLKKVNKKENLSTITRTKIRKSINNLFVKENSYFFLSEIRLS